MCKYRRQINDITFTLPAHSSALSKSKHCLSSHLSLSTEEMPGKSKSSHGGSKSRSSKSHSGGNSSSNKESPTTKKQQHTTTTTQQQQQNERQVQEMADQENLVADTYRVGPKLGGTFGMVRAGRDVLTNQEVAIKFAKVDAKQPTNAEQLLRTENTVYRLMSGKTGFAVVLFYGRFRAHFQVLVMERLGPNLQAVFEKCGRRFTLKSHIYLALQLLKRLEELHKVGYLFRDLKPSNITLGHNNNVVYLVDFGCAKAYMIEEETKEKKGKKEGEKSDDGKKSGGGGTAKKRHISPGPCTDEEEPVGTMRYRSVNAHLCKNQSRRDDLESLGYVFAYFLCGKLPWMGIMVDSPEEHNKLVCNMKRNLVESELLDGHPAEFAHFLKYSRALKFEEAPEYDKLREKFKQLFRVNNLTDDGVYDWNRD